MDQQIVNNDSLQTSKILLKRSLWTVIFMCCLISLLIAIPIGFAGYEVGYTQGKQQEIKSYIPPAKAKKIASKPKDVVPSSSTPSPEPMNSYVLIYTAPTEWRSMVWQPDPNNKGSAILSPDYTSIADPNPQTGLVILIYQFPDQFKDMTQFRSSVEEVEDNLKDLTQTVVGGYPAWHAIFVSTDSERVINDYHILKDHDHWVVRIIVPGNSLLVAQAEEQKYNYQINNLIQSIQFKNVQN